MQRGCAYQRYVRHNRSRVFGHTIADIGRGCLSALLCALIAAGCANTLTPDPAVRYVAFGDSTTAGAADRDYHDFLSEMLDEPPETFANAGSGGESAEMGLERLRHLIDHEIYPNAQTLFYWQGGAAILEFIAETDPFLLMRPDAPDYPFHAQLAQVLETTQSHIEQAIEAGHRAGWTVYVATYYPLPTWPTPCDPMWLDIMLPAQARNANVYRRMLNEHIRQAVARQSAILVDVEAIEQLGTNPDQYVDCNHLSTEGNRIVAESFSEVVTQSDSVE